MTCSWNSVFCRVWLFCRWSRSVSVNEVLLGVLVMRHRWMFKLGEKHHRPAALVRSDKIKTSWVLYHVSFCVPRHSLFTYFQSTNVSTAAEVDMCHWKSLMLHSNGLESRQTYSQLNTQIWSPKLWNICQAAQKQCIVGAVGLMKGIWIAQSKRRRGRERRI